MSISSRCLRNPGIRRSIAERIEIDDQQINRANAMCIQFRKIIRHVPPRQDCGMHRRMQRLDPPAEQFAEPGYPDEFAHLYTLGPNCIGRSSRRQDFDVQFRKAAGKSPSPDLSWTDTRARLTGDCPRRFQLVPIWNSRESNRTFVTQLIPCMPVPSGSARCRFVSSSRGQSGSMVLLRTKTRRGRRSPRFQAWRDPRSGRPDFIIRQPDIHAVVPRNHFDE